MRREEEMVVRLTARLLAVGEGEVNLRNGHDDDQGERLTVDGMNRGW